MSDIPQNSDAAAACSPAAAHATPSVPSRPRTDADAGAGVAHGTQVQPGVVVLGEVRVATGATVGEGEEGGEGGEGGEEAEPEQRVILPLDVVPFNADTESIEYIGTQGRKITIIDGLDVCTQLNNLCFRSNLISDMLGLATLTRLRTLELYDNRLRRIEDLAACTQLEVLDLTQNRIASLAGLSTLTALRRLYVASNRIRRIEGLEACTQLEMLDLGNNRIERMENLAHLTALQELWLGKNKISVIEGIEPLTQLRILDVQSNRLTDMSPTLLSLPAVQQLYLAFNRISVITNLGAMRALNTLDLTHNVLTSCDGLEAQEKLEDLWLGYNQVASWAEVAKVAASCTSLSVIYLEHNPIAKEWEYRIKLTRAIPTLTQIDATAVRGR